MSKTLVWVSGAVDGLGLGIARNTPFPDARIIKLRNYEDNLKNMQDIVKYNEKRGELALWEQGWAPESNAHMDLHKRPQFMVCSYKKIGTLLRRSLLLG